MCLRCVFCCRSAVGYPTGREAGTGRTIVEVGAGDERDLGELALADDLGGDIGDDTPFAVDDRYELELLEGQF